MKRQQRSSQQNVVDDRLGHSLKRMHQMLQPGLSSADIGVQNQTLRAISEFLSSVSSSYPSSLPLLKRNLREILVAFRKYLRVNNPELQCRAAKASGLLISMLESGVEPLIPPLVALISDTQSLSLTVAAAAAISLKIVIAKLKSRDAEILFRDGKVVEKLVLILENEIIEEKDEDVVASAAAVMQLLALILERYCPSHRFKVGRRQLLRDNLFKICHSNHLLAHAALQTLSSLALCAGVAQILLTQNILYVLSLGREWLQPSTPLHIQTTMLRLLHSLLRLPSFQTSINNYDISWLAVACIKGLEYSNKKGIFEEDILLLEYSNLVSLLLSAAGKHHIDFLKAGLVDAVYASLVSPKRTNGAVRNILVQSIGWACSHCDKLNDCSSFSILVEHLCGAFVKTVAPKGRRCSMLMEVEEEEECYAQVTLSRTMLLMLSQERFQSTVRNALQRHCTDISSGPLVASVKLSYSCDAAKLYGIAALSYLSNCRKELIERKASEVMLTVIKENCDSRSCRGDSRSCRSGSRSSVCCEASSSWCGSDGILFAALWAYSSLMRDSDADDDPDAMEILLKVAGDENAADGVRWWAACNLRRYGIFGFPNMLGRCFTDSSSTAAADVVFVFSDGRSLQAHAAILAARCPSLVPQITEGAPVSVHISSRITYEAMESVLAYLYTGSVRIGADDGERIAGMKTLAKRCELKSLLILLRGEVPEWGMPPDRFDLRTALRNVGREFCDVWLESVQGGDPVPAHRIILSSTSEYFQALFRSGMADSSSKQIKVPESREVIARFVDYLYSGELHYEASVVSECARKFVENEENLEQLVDLAELSKQWLQQDLEKKCQNVIVDHLRSNSLLCVRVMKHAAKRHQLEIVVAAAECVAPEFPKLRDAGALDELDDELMDLLRSCYVEMMIQRAPSDVLY